MSGKVSSNRSGARKSLFYKEIDRLGTAVLLFFRPPARMPTPVVFPLFRACNPTLFFVITGFNTDVEHAGTTYHVQTEDKGLETPLILSLVYVGGAILASKRTSYQDLIEGGFEETTLVERLQRQHKLLCAAIRAGRIEDLKRMSADAREAAHASPAAPATIPVAPEPPIVSTPATATAPTGAPATIAPDLPPPVPPVAPPSISSDAPAPVSSGTPAPVIPAQAVPATPAESSSVAPVAPPAVSVKSPAAKETPARTPRSKPAPSAARKTSPAPPAEIELLPVTDSSFEAANAPEAASRTATPVDAPAGVDASFELISANDPSFLHRPETPPAVLPTPTPSSPPETHASATGQASANHTARTHDGGQPTGGAASEIGHAPLASLPDTPPAPVASEKDAHLYITLLDDEGEFRAGELVTIRIYVGLGQYGVMPVGDAAVTVKILGTTFRPLILSTKTGADGTAVVRALLPRFTSGRAAILIRARAGEQDAELRRIIHHT